jgi:hypothetical protein
MMMMMMMMMIKYQHTLKPINMILSKSFSGIIKVVETEDSQTHNVGLIWVHSKQLWCSLNDSFLFLEKMKLARRMNNILKICLVFFRAVTAAA